MAANNRPKIHFESVEELLGAPVMKDGTEVVKIKDIFPFKDHPFKVLDDEKMDELVESIKANGVLSPVLIPCQAAYLPVKGLQQLIKTIYTVKRQLNKELEIEGILLTMVDGRTTYAKDIVMEVNDVYGKSIPVFPIEIPLSVRAAETSAMAKSIYDYDPKGKAAFAYMSLTKEVLAHGC